MKKRILSMLLAATMVGTLASGCGKTEPKQTNASSTETSVGVEEKEYKNVHITFLNRVDVGQKDGQWYQKKIKEFMEKYPGIQVESISIPTEADYLDQESVLMSDANSMPDIFQEYGGSRVANYIKADNLVDLSPYYEADAKWKNSFGEVGWGLTDFKDYGYEGVYGVPWSTYFISLFYNEDLLKQANVSPDSIKSWDDLMSACKKLKDAGIQPFEIGEKDNYRFGHLHTVLNYKTYGTDIALKLGKDEVSYDGEEEKAIYQMMIDATKKGYLGTNLLGYDDDQERELFNTGKAAFLFMGSWYCAEASTGKNELYNQKKVHTIAFPYVNEKYQYSDMGGANECYYVTNTGNQDKIDASVLLLKYLTSQSNIDELVSTYPVLTAVNPTATADNYLVKEVSDLMKQSKDIKGDIENYDTHQHMINTVRNALQGIPTGHTAEEVGKDIVETSKEYE